MAIRDLISQLKNWAVVAGRFSDSAWERELVKAQIKLGKSPAEIEIEERVKLRVEDLGIEKGKAAKLARSFHEATTTDALRSTPRPKNPGLERIIGDNNLISSVFLERGAEAAKSVCCIHKNGEGRIGTGFLVAPRVLLTNSHVIKNEGTALRCQAEFNYEDRRDGKGIEPVYSFQLRPKELFYTSDENELDYTLVAVAPKSGQKSLNVFRYLPLNTSVANALRGECLNILQHPNGAPKRLALRQNRFTALLERHVHYESDTLPGSSGSPVFNDQWQVICLHHSGVPLKDAKGNILTVDNRIWKEDDNPVLIKWIGNEGIRITRIIADVIRQVRAEKGDHWPALLAKFPREIDNPPNEEEKLENDPNRAPATNGSVSRRSGQRKQAAPSKKRATPKRPPASKPRKAAAKKKSGRH